MKASILTPSAMACVVLVSSLFHNEPVLGDGCPVPSFAAPRTFDVGSNPISVTVGDFNGDGKPDLAVANIGDPYSSPLVSGNVSVLLETATARSRPSVTTRERVLVPRPW